MFYTNYLDFLFFEIAESDLAKYLDIDPELPELKELWLATLPVFVPTIRVSGLEKLN